MQKSRSSIFLLCTPFLLVIYVLTGCCSGDEKVTSAGKDWPVYLGDNSSSHYSSLTEINKDNISQLELAWIYHTGDDISENHTQIQCNPIIIGGIMYATSPRLKVFALDAATGRQLWEFDPDPENQYAQNVNRGVSYWQKGSDKRIYSHPVPVYLH